MYLQTQMLRFERKFEFGAVQAFRDAVVDRATGRIGDCAVSGEIAALDAIRFEFMSDVGLQPKAAATFQEIVWELAAAHPQYGRQVEIEPLATHIPAPEQPTGAGSDAGAEAVEPSPGA